jgi:hypothetical protein
VRAEAAAAADAHVLIPVLIENVQPPIQFRMLESIDLMRWRSGAGENEGLDVLLTEVRVRSGREAREQLLQQLRNPTMHCLAVADLREHALTGSDDALQVAALRGLQQVGGPEALLAVAERSLESYLVRPIRTDLSILSRLHADGGLLVLSSSLLIDLRFLYERLARISEGLERLGSGTFALDPRWNAARSESDLRLATLLPEILDALETSGVDDLRHGSVLCRLVQPMPAWAVGCPEPPADAGMATRMYAHRRLPGFLELLLQPRRPVPYGSQFL